MSDIITEIEQHLATFTQRLSEGITAISDQTQATDQVTKNRLVNSVSFDLANVHKKILSLIEKMPEDMLGQSRHQQEVEIEDLQREYQQVTRKLEIVQQQAKDLSGNLKTALEQIKNA